MTWEGLTISDCFLWPEQERSLKAMKLFALDFLSDYLRKDIHNYSCQSLESKKLLFSLIIIFGRLRPASCLHH